MNIRGWLYSKYASFKGRGYPVIFEKLCQEIDAGISPEISTKNLRNILSHCRKNVPYYTQIMSLIDDDQLLEQNPAVYLQKLPVLTKDVIRQNFDQLKSKDLPKRNWYFNQSGGSTGEPLKFIQDREYSNRSMAIKSLYSYWVANRKIGESEVVLWGSERDLSTKKSIQAELSSFLRNTTYMNAFLMTPEKMKDFIQKLNSKPPKIIVAYAQAIYELAQFTENKQISIVPQKAIITTATTLYPWMREKIESVFQCRVFNRYGSREVGDIACELHGKEGLYIAPWGNYIEIVDDDNNPVPLGVEGNILITNFNNYAMPLIRYKIGDRGSLLVNETYSQILQQVTGRNADMFKRKDGTLVYGGYFTKMIYFKDWIDKFQVIQIGYTEIQFKIKKQISTQHPSQTELNDITKKCRRIMGQDCQVKFEFVDKILPGLSGKYRYTISNI